MAGTRAEWSKPELTILARSRPEEAVLAACKLGAGDSGPIGGKNYCRDKVTGKCTGTLCASAVGS